jgi:hypothetical protein
MFKRLFSAITVIFCICIFPFGFLSCHSSQERDNLPTSSPPVETPISFQECVDLPEFSPPGGIYYSSLNISISCKTEDANIRILFDMIPSGMQGKGRIHYYVFNENLNLFAFSNYSGPIKFDRSRPIVAQAFKKGMADNDQVCVIYEILDPVPVSTPIFANTQGIFNTPQKITIYCLTRFATIRYTTDGSEPTNTSILYDGPITINATTFFKAKAFLDYYPDSATANATYSFTELGKLQDK